MKSICGLSSIPDFLTLALITVSLLCCSVKEDRDSCPCQLRFDLSEAFDNSDLTMVVMGESGFVRCDTLRKKDSLKTFSLKVPRERLSVDVYSPFGALRNPIEGYRPKERCDSLWSCSFKIVAEGESMEQKIKLYKNYCALRIRFTGGYPQGHGYTLLFKSLICGYLPGGGLREGYYSEHVNALPDGSFEVNILRQNDSSLMMEIISEDNVLKSGVLRSFALGEYISASAYDWNEDNLEDLDMEIDFASSSIRISTDKWSRTLEFSVVI